VEYGMSALGPMNLDGENNRMPYEQSQISPEMAARIDEQVKQLTDEGYRKAAEILKKLRSKLDVLAEELLQKETLESEEFERLIGSKPATPVVKV